MSHYVVIHSDGCANYFPDNKPYHFRSHFQSPLNLHGTWKVALVDITLTSFGGTKTRKNLYLHSDICEESFLDGEKEALLRPIRALKVAYWSQSFDTPYYIPVKKTDVRDIELFIKTGKGEYASFLTDRVTVTLHFKQYPFLS